MYGCVCLKLWHLHLTHILQMWFPRCMYITFALVLTSNMCAHLQFKHQYHDTFHLTLNDGDNDMCNLPHHCMSLSLCINLNKPFWYLKSILINSMYLRCYKHQHIKGDNLCELNDKLVILHLFKPLGNFFTP